MPVALPVHAVAEEGLHDGVDLLPAVCAVSSPREGMGVLLRGCAGKVEGDAAGHVAAVGFGEVDDGVQSLA